MEQSLWDNEDHSRYTVVWYIDIYAFICRHLDPENKLALDVIEQFNLSNLLRFAKNPINGWKNLTMRQCCR